MSPIPFPKHPIRAWVIIPAGTPNQDWCHLKAGGWPIDGEPPLSAGPLDLLYRAAKYDPRGLPVAVHRECERRAAI